MADPIFLIPDGSTANAIRLDATEYRTEDEFQTLLERFPELLAGEQIDRANPRRWLLVAREIGVADGDETASRWSLDHLFVDQDGIPTLVEVKRQSDTRLRREVIGQVLEYAANAARWWPASFLKEQFVHTVQKKGEDPALTLSDFLQGTALQPDAFWQVVEEKLRTGDMRLIFFADRIPAELLRIIEFLNSQTLKTELLAVEVLRYSGRGYSTHIPRLLGQTDAAQQAKEGVRASTQRRVWDEKTFFAELENTGPQAVTAARQVFALHGLEGFDVRFGTGASQGAINVYRAGVGSHCLVSIQTTGKLQLQLGSLLASPTETEAARALVNFAVRHFGYVESPQTPRQYPSFAAGIWTPHVDALVAELKRLG